MKQGFDNAKYVHLQSERIRERIAAFGGKLYLEFGGKLFDDHHASRVLPGFHPDSKLTMLKTLSDRAEIVIVVNAHDIESNKVRGDLGIGYDSETLRLIDSFREAGFYVGSVVITHFSGHAAEAFQAKLESQGVRVYRHYKIEGYPSNLKAIVSDEGYGKNEYIETERELVVITAPGPGSGKMATCLSQLYHENKRGIQAGYAKFETFPIWNLPLKHPVNLAYEAATADLKDVNMLDPYHLEAYGQLAVNYNRDVEIFPVLRAIFERIQGQSPYRSPTDMGVNMAGFCITDDDACSDASRREIVRRYYAVQTARLKGTGDEESVHKIEILMEQAGVSPENRRAAVAANRLEQQTGKPAAALEFSDGSIVTGKTTDLLGASSAMLLNALKVLAGIPDEVKLMSRRVIEPIQRLKVDALHNRNPRLHTDEVLVALSICAVDDPDAARAIRELPHLAGLEAHTSVLLSPVDEDTFRRLGINLTCEPKRETQRLYYR
ncbi:MAG TPA: DUF1846 domain-containing protein [Candidatus Pullichristensenella excrementigallinarum]|uniref:DUF1846 domain-containing protein n=1 Tax=Candidatus Pullichristensenella excrementigallinarum TaxID=2840907 RepID=A0A9D1LCJ4_9FIRM|nr:DUF1846 domain-containing protein [Candidatus Pullichristensenella excrementigallinarum]